MKLYEEPKSLKSIPLHPFIKKRSEFLEKVKIQVHESEEGIPSIDFHGLIFSLTKAYLEEVNDCSIQEEKMHTMLELESMEEKFSAKKDFYAFRVCNVNLLKAGLKNWEKK